MRASRLSGEQMLHLWHRAERGEQPIGARCREHGISEQTFYRWRKTVGGMTVPDTQRSPEWEREKARLKRLLAERALEVDALKVLLAKKSSRWRPAVRPSNCWSRGGSRRACVLLQLRRSTFGHQARPARHAELTAQLTELARRHPRFGYRRVWALLRRRGHQVHKKPGHRLWKRAKLQVRRVTRRRRLARREMTPVQATPPGHVWTDDVLRDRCRKGTPLQVLTVMDEFTRDGLALEAATALPSARVLAILQGSVVTHGAPQFVRSDNGPEFIALAVRGWLAQHQMTTVVHRPRLPLAERVRGALQRHRARRMSE